MLVNAPSEDHHFLLILKAMCKLEMAAKRCFELINSQAALIKEVQRNEFSMIFVS